MRWLTSCMLMLLISAAVTAQSIVPTVKLPKGSMSIRQIIHFIVVSTGFSICWESDTVDPTQRIYSKGEDISILKIMNLIISQNEADYIIEGKTIFIKKKSKINRRIPAEVDSL